MSKTSTEPKWLREDEAERARQYMRNRIKQEHLTNLVEVYVSIFVSGDPYPLAIDAIRALEDAPGGWKVIQGLRNALRQHRHRSGKKKRAFLLPPPTAAQLRHLAKQRQQTETSIVTSLIDDAERLNREDSEQVKKLKDAITLEREHRQSEADSHKRKLDEAMQQLENHLRRLAMWETIYGGELPSADLDEAAIKQLVERSMKQASIAIRRAGQDELFSSNPDW